MDRYFSSGLPTGEWSTPWDSRDRGVWGQAEGLVVSAENLQRSVEDIGPGSSMWTCGSAVLIPPSGRARGTLLTWGL